MMILTLNGNRLKTVIAAVLGIMLCYSIYHYCVQSCQASVNTRLNVELFDIGKGCVIKMTPVDDAVLAESKKIIKGITGYYLKANAIPEKGNIIKIPFEPDLNVRNKWLNNCGIKAIDKMYIVYPEEGTPYVLILDKRGRPYLYNFGCDANRLLNKVND
ncbi:MAG: hypothetical protein ABFD25_21170 [Clostridiaceae bacterium]